MFLNYGLNIQILCLSQDLLHLHSKDGKEALELFRGRIKWQLWKIIICKCIVSYHQHMTSKYILLLQYSYQIML